MSSAASDNKSPAPGAPFFGGLFVDVVVAVAVRICNKRRPNYNDYENMNIPYHAIHEDTGSREYVEFVFWFRCSTF